MLHIPFTRKHFSLPSPWRGVGGEAVLFLLLLAATAAQAQTLTTTNIEKEVSTENAGMRIYMDWPVSGPQKLVDDVRNYIIGVLRDRAGG